MLREADMMEIRRLAALLVLGWWSHQAHGETTASASASSAAASSAMDSSSSSSSTAELAPVTMMDTGSFHTVVVIRDSMVNVVKDWGANGKGQVSDARMHLGVRTVVFLTEQM